MRLSELQNKTVINLIDGKNIGNIIDLNIDEKGNALLHNGSVVNSSNIEKYIIVNKGSGNWYNEEENCLIVEIGAYNIIAIIKNFVKLGVFTLLLMIFIMLIRKDRSALTVFALCLYLITTVVGVCSISVLF